MSAKTDIECPRCHRISFAHETRHSCEECHWPIRPDPVENPYGHEVLIELRSDNGLTTTTEVRHFKGSATRARARAKVRGRVLGLVPVAEADWIRAYGEGRM